MAAAAVLGSLGSAAGKTGTVSVDYGVRIIAPVDEAGAPTHRRATVGVPLRLEVELYTTRAAGTASLSYDMFLPTDVVIPLEPLRMRDGRATSRCLRVCNVGWDTTRTLGSSVFYALVPPKPGSFIVAVHIVSTDRADPRVRNNSVTLTIPVATAQLALGVPEPVGGAPRAGRTFTVGVTVRRSGTSVKPTSARCDASVGANRLTGTVSRQLGRVRCSWSIPATSAGATLRTSVTAAVGSLTVSRSWSYAIRRRP